MLLLPDCVSLLPSLPAEPLKSYTPATRPFEFIIVVVDHFSGWPHMVMFPNKITTARCLINAFRTFFVDIGGLPVKLWADNSPFKRRNFNFFSGTGTFLGDHPPLTTINQMAEQKPQSNR